MMNEIIRNNGYVSSQEKSLVDKNTSVSEEKDYTVTLNFSDGVTKTFSVSANENILDAALDSNMPLLYQCRSGSCSSCICTLNNGYASTIQGASSTLLKSEYELGHRLLCVSKAESDCTFDLAYGSEVGVNGAHDVHVFIDAVEFIGVNTVRLTVELAEDQYMDFRPGQFMQILVPEIGVFRSYSPSSTKLHLPKMEFLIRIIPGGVMSKYLVEQAHVDQVLTLSGPYGSFFLREEHKRSPHIFIAGGTGLAPILSMIDSLRQSGGIKPKMLLNFGCATPEALFCLEDLQLREQWLPTLETRICVSDGAQEGHYSGNPVSPLTAADVTDPNTVAYLCGPQPMIDAATSRLLELGVKAENIFAEQFVASN